MRGEIYDAAPTCVMTLTHRGTATQVVRVMPRWTSKHIFVAHSLLGMGLGLSFCGEAAKGWETRPAAPMACTAGAFRFFA